MEPRPTPGFSTYTVQEVATILRRSENSVIAAINRGELPGKRMGRLYRIPKQTFDAWLITEEPVRRRSPHDGWEGVSIAERT